jgi:hypothetical protein
VQSIGIEMSEALNIESERLLAEQDNARVSILLNTNYVCLGTYLPGGCWTADRVIMLKKREGISYCKWEFKKMGMKPLDDEGLKHSLLGVLFDIVMKYTQREGNPTWMVSKIYNSTQLQYPKRRASVEDREQYIDDYMSIELVNIYSGEALYDDWV